MEPKRDSGSDDYWGVLETWSSAGLNFSFPLFCEPLESLSLSSRVLRALHKASIVSASAPFVVTSNITRQFAHQVSSISVHRQRKLVGLLFFWEEELVRWRLLDDEEAEIRRVLAEVVNVAYDTEGEPDGHPGEDLRLALGKVLARKRMLPGMRGEEGTGGLPGYGDGGTVSVVGGRAAES